MAFMPLVAGPALVVAGVLSAQEPDRASALLSAVEGTDPAACQLILNALDRQWNDRGMRASTMLYDRADREAGGLAAWAQRSEPDEVDGRVFMGGLSAPDRCVQSVSARMLGRVDDPEVTARLIAVAGDARSPGRKASMVALGHIGSEDAVPRLADALGDPDPEVRYTAAVALGQIESSDAIPALAAALASDSDVAVRRAVTWALGKIE